MTITENTSEAHLHARATALSIVGRWAAANENLPWSPAPDSRPMHWPYADIRPLAVDAASMIKGDRAALRVLTLLNPGHDREATTGHLYSGLQIINPGEAMTPHRHAPTALRYMHEGDSAWTAVGGNKMFLEPRDIVVTPAEHWHEHGNDSLTETPTIWQDCTNDPLVSSLAATRFELHTEPTHLEPSVLARGRTDPNPATPLLHRWRDTERALNRRARSGTPDPHRAHRYTLRAPGTQNPITPVLDASFTLIPARGHTRPLRRTVSSILITASGEPTVHVDDQSYDTRSGDTVAVPSWSALRFTNSTSDPVVVFEFTDAPTIAALGLYREQKEN